jgi:hypothetical protein
MLTVMARLPNKNSSQQDNVVRKQLQSARDKKKLGNSMLIPLKMPVKQFWKAL